MNNSTAPQQLMRIAHAYGNRRHRINRAVEAGVDLIEADLRYWRGEIWVRHENRLDALPVLFNFGLKPGIHREGPWSAHAGTLFVRLDVRPIRFHELLERVSGQSGLLLDLKAARYSSTVAKAFVSQLLAEFEEFRFDGDAGFCGAWPLLDLVRARRPDLALHYSVDNATDWLRLQPRLSGQERIGGISLRCGLIDPERIAMLRDACVDYYAWDVKSDGDATLAVEAGASGIIADDLRLLRDLRGVPVRGVEGG